MNSDLNKQAQTLEITFSRKTKSHHSQTCSNNILRIYLNEKLNFYHHIIEINAQIHIYFFSIRAFFHRHWQLTGQQGKGGDHLLFHSTTSTRSQAFRHLLFATLHVRWLSHIFNRTACIYQVATRWDLPRYRITIWLTDDVTLSFFLFTWWFDSWFSLLQQFGTGNRWIQTRIDYHPCIKSKPTNQVC